MDVDGLLAALEALIAKKRAVKQAAMQQLLTGKSRLPGFSGAWETTSDRRSCGYKERSNAKHSDRCLLERADSVVHTYRHHGYAGEVPPHDRAECH